MDGATIFIFALAAGFFGFIIYLAVLSRRTTRTATADHKPRNVA